MIRKRNLFLCQRIHSRCDLFGLCAVVDENQSSARFTNVSENERRYGRPYAATDVAEIGNGRLDGDFHLFRQAAVNYRDGSELRHRNIRVAPAKKARDFVERALRGGQSD